MTSTAVTSTAATSTDPTPTDVTALRHRPVSRRCALFGAGGIGAAALLTACSAGSDETTAGTSGTSPSAAGSSSSVASGPASSAAATGGSSAPGGAAIASLADVPVGGTASVEVDGETVLLSQPTAGTVEGFGSACPHQGATVQPDGAGFRCPLHGSMFDIDGAVTQGPAREGLSSFAVTVSGDQIVAA